MQGAEIGLASGLLGLFVQLETYYVDGLVPIRTMGDDYYLYEAEAHRPDATGGIVNWGAAGPDSSVRPSIRRYLQESIEASTKVEAAVRAALEECPERGSKTFGKR